MAYYHRRARKSSTSQPFLLFILLVVVVAVGLSSYSTILSPDTLTLWMYVLGGIAFIMGAGLLWFIAYQRMRRLRALQLSQIDTMTGIEFEQYVGELLKFQGYHIEFTKMSGDFGGDIVARKEHVRYVYQLKRYNKSVDLHAVQEAVAAMKYYNCQTCGVITNNSFTPAAKKLAKVNGCMLIDREQLAEWILAFQTGKTNR